MPLKGLFLKEKESTATVNLEEILANIPDASDANIQEDTFEVMGNMEGIAFVEEVYAKLGMTENKIYEVIPYIDSLPNTLDSVTKKTTLLNLLQHAAKFNLTDLSDNADQCLSVLKTAREATITASETALQEMQSVIAAKELEIEELRAAIANEKTKCERQIAIFDDESNKLRVIKNHIV